MSAERTQEVFERLLNWATEVCADINDVIYACGLTKSEAKELGLLPDED